MILQMASRRRMRRNSCEGKARHKTEADAQLALRLSKRTGRFRGAMRVYSCSNCGHFHTGHVGRRTVLKWNGLFSKRDFQTQ
jgi:ribosomal protein L32